MRLLRRARRRAAPRRGAQWRMRRLSPRAVRRMERGGSGAGHRRLRMRPDGRISQDRRRYGGLNGDGPRRPPAPCRVVRRQRRRASARPATAAVPPRRRPLGVHHRWWGLNPPVGHSRLRQCRRNASEHSCSGLQMSPVRSRRDAGTTTGGCVRRGGHSQSHAGTQPQTRGYHRETPWGRQSSTARGGRRCGCRRHRVTKSRPPGRVSQQRER